MSDEEREEWRSALRAKLLNPAPASYTDPGTESTFEFRPDLNATIEKTPDGRRFMVVFLDGQLRRQDLVEADPPVRAG